MSRCGAKSRNRQSIRRHRGSATAPGYEKIELRPEVPAAGIDRVSISCESVRGTITSQWRKQANGLEMEITVPPNATGVVYVPASEKAKVTSNATRGAGKRDGGRVVYEVGSGRYQFSVR
jgi:alpha-L-rhamnosidase